MEKLESTVDFDGPVLRCKGWCHDKNSGEAYNVPSVDYFE